MKASLEKRLETVDEVELEVSGIQRVMKPTSGNPVEWHSYYSPEGLYSVYRFSYCCYGFPAFYFVIINIICTL